MTCRNVLIYFERILQKRIISTFHYCLNQPGFLVLGRTEGISGHEHFFSALDKTNKIFSREGVTSQLRYATMQNTPGQTQAFRSGSPLSPLSIDPRNPSGDVPKQIDHLLISKYVPSGVVINERFEVLQYRGQTSLYLEPPPGQPQLNLLKMVREGLFATLKMALAEAKKKMLHIKKENLQFKQNGIAHLCNLVVIPLTRNHDSKELLFVVLFEEVSLPKSKKGKAKPAKTKSGKLKQEKESEKAEKLGLDLRTAQEYLHSLNEEHQHTNETLSSVNEELVSSNEELQSMNEELETAKEELQSTNEELSTVNDELQNRNHETALVNDDLVNLLNSSDIPILILDLNRRIRRFTPKARKMMNLLPSDIGRPIDDIALNIITENLGQQIQDVIETVTTKESEVQDRDGKWHRLQIRPYKTADNRIAGTVLSLVDIHRLRELLSESQEAKTDADKANITKDLFLATLSHELRTPLTSLILQAQLLERGPLDEEKVKKASIAIVRAARMQTQLIEDLLDVSRIVTGKLQIELKPTDLSKVILAALDTVSAIAEEKSVKFILSLDPSVGRVSGDPVRLQQVVWNLLTNAIKFSAQRSEVIVTLKSGDGYAKLEVIDAGIGIATEFLPHVFKRFSQAEDTITRSHGGLGLGLAIVRHVVEMHDGNVKVESPGKNKGTTFTVTLPLMNDAAKETESQESNPISLSDRDTQKSRPATFNGQLNGLRILLVEDDLGAREAITEVLTRAGAQAKAAASASEAMQVLNDFEPDVLVLDISMPQESGYSLLRRIRKLGKTMPALALTALASEKDREEALSAGFQMHLVKPVDFDQLIGALLELSERGQIVL